tara:strand:- start:3051 stop:3458 length:408 start_codon:yes stop_codon:yes gene_type:complete
MSNLTPNPILNVLPQLAAIKEMGSRFPSWPKVMNLANQCMYAQAGITVLTDSMGNSFQVPQAQLAQIQGAQPQAQLTAANQVADTTDEIQALKAEINKTQGRALHNVESKLNARFDKIEKFLESLPTVPVVPDSA